MNAHEREMTTYRGVWTDCTFSGAVDTDVATHRSMKEMMRDVRTHGVVAADVNGRPHPMYVRLGTAMWDFTTEVLYVVRDDGERCEILFERIVDWDKPMDLH